MKRRLLTMAVVSALAVGCGGQSDLPTTTDQKAIEEEQKRLQGEMPGGSPVDTKGDAIRAEQERLRKGP